MASKQTIKEILEVDYDDDDFDDDPGSIGSSSRTTGTSAAGVRDVDEDVYYVNHRRMSRLSLGSEGDDADVEPSEEEEDEKEAVVPKSSRVTLADVGFNKDEFLSGTGVSSMPGTPARGSPVRVKEYASENEAGGRRRRHGRRRTRAERWLERAWEMKKGHAAAEDGSDGGRDMSPSCRVLVPSGLGRSGRMYMNMDEVRACRDLGLGLPADCTVEIPGAFSDLTADTSSGGNSPIANWRISSPGN